MSRVQTDLVNVPKVEAKSILETKSLTRRFRKLVAVDHVSISISQGEMFGLVGPNGAGKTTVIKMLTTLLAPTSGDAWVAGYDVVHHSAQVRRVIGYVPQLLSADGSLTAYENLLIFAKLYHIPRRERERRIHDALSFMGLDEVSDKMVREYSGGMIRRLEIAESMLHRPKVLFLDEPTVGLDPIARKAVWDHIQRLRSDFGTTILLTTHYMEEADELCDRVAIMHLGKIAAIGTPSELKATVGEGATLDDVFVHYSGYEVDNVGNFRDVSRTRRVARRLG
ncbi:MAG: ATP-binding cassette domain-containing protein [Candidatus Bathyarchaeia archaeon]|jgi:ABC-2 type transport system ATP-binding protein